MKVPVLGLAIAVTAFAGSSLYLWLQLKEERARAAQVEETTRQLHARISELEKARVLFAQNRAPAKDSPPAVPTAQTPGMTPSWPEEMPPEVRAAWEEQVREGPSPAALKMMRTGIRADVRRQYGEFVRNLGLGKEMTSRLLDLLTDQQVGDFAHLPTFNDAQQYRSYFEEKQRANEAAIADLIGSDKAAELKAYQQSIPSRQEFEMLAQQLDGSDAPLTPEQHNKLQALWIDERARVAPPDINSGLIGPNYVHAFNEWNDEFLDRVRSGASHILDAEQLGAFDEIQKFQREMREQNAGFSAVAVPVSSGMAGDVMFSTSAVFNAPAPGPEPTKKAP